MQAWQESEARANASPLPNNQDLEQELQAMSSPSDQVKTPTEYKLLDGASSFSGVLELKDAEDIEYEGLQIDGEVHKRYLKNQIDDKMKPINDYPAMKVLEDELDGFLSRTNSENEKKKNVDRIDQVMADNL